jgi:ubiquinol-cytochrome c reductase cytochrome c subunit
MTLESRAGRLFAAAAALVCAGLACVAAAAVAAAQESPQGLYERNCAGCHGPRGEGASAPSLAAAAFPDIVEEKVRRGGGGMPAFVDPPGEEWITVISGYVAHELADPQAREATVSGGGQDYRLYCSGCHGSSGRGGALMGDTNAPSLADLPAADALAAMITGPGNMPLFAGAALNVRQQAAVSRYIADAVIDPPSPGGNGLGYLGPVTEGAFAVVVGFGLLVLITVWLAWKKGDEALG